MKTFIFALFAFFCHDSFSMQLFFEHGNHRYANDLNLIDKKYKTVKSKTKLFSKNINGNFYELKEYNSRKIIYVKSTHIDNNGNLQQDNFYWYFNDANNRCVAYQYVTTDRYVYEEYENWLMNNSGRIRAIKNEQTYSRFNIPIYFSFNIIGEATKINLGNAVDVLSVRTSYFQITIYTKKF